ncbi:hypothetical protein CJ030_MR5G003638 [Morella rubra]|uniref:Uncharacterized protein n=1 Tax=Morella rubra TaxID=262757 RepID=A0A6A1VK28_9ROSI|nr:hypothetical protein CJ030_MR5G003638 [Morella rubra]
MMTARRTHRNKMHVYVKKFSSKKATLLKPHPDTTREQWTELCNLFTKEAFLKRSKQNKINARKCKLPPRADRWIYSKKPSKKKSATTDQQGAPDVASGEKVQKRKKKKRGAANGDSAETSRDDERRNARAGGSGGQIRAYINVD